MKRTYQPKAGDLNKKRNWHLVDAKDMVLGRISTKIASYLMGKHKAVFSKHEDMGDCVVVINAEKVILTGKKEDDKMYRRHSGYPGGFRELTAKQVREKYPERLVQKAVEGMLPDNRLKRGRMNRLKVVVGSKHPFDNKFKEEKK